MDGSHFDRLVVSLTTTGSRRRVLVGLLAGALGLVGWSEPDASAHDLAAKCKKKSGAAKKTCLRKARKHKASHQATCTRNCSGKQCGSDGCGGVCGGCVGRQVCDAAGVCCLPNCFDRVCGPDGCGGSCGRCPLVGQVCNRGACECPTDKPVACNGGCAERCESGTVRHPQTCDCCIASRKDCSTACAETCCSGRWIDGQNTNMCWGFGTGEACTFNEQCHSLNCVNGRCEECYEYTDFCYYGYGTRGYGTGSDICGPQQTGQCLKTVAGPPRCGVPSRNVDCNGCSNDIDCLVELGQGSGAFCVRDSGPHCDCPDGQTFCAVPR
jgi:hypothetical protein